MTDHDRTRHNRPDTTGRTTESDDGPTRAPVTLRETFVSNCGTPPGPVPYGYRRDAAGIRQPDPDTAPAIARMIQLRRWGVSLRVICQVLTAEGYPGPRGQAWHPWRVLMVLRRELGPEEARYGQHPGRPYRDGRSARRRVGMYAPVPRELRELARDLGRMPPDSVVAGVDVSGLLLDDALDAVRAEVPVEPDPPRDWPLSIGEELAEELRGCTLDEVLDVVRLLRSNLDI